MSTQQSSQALGHHSTAGKKLLASQSGQWHEIGISAVAAAARQASDKSAQAKLANKVVTLRDIDHLAA